MQQYTKFKQELRKMFLKICLVYKLTDSDCFTIQLKVHKREATLTWLSERSSGGGGNSGGGCFDGLSSTGKHRVSSSILTLFFLAKLRIRLIILASCTKRSMFTIKTSLHIRNLKQKNILYSQTHFNRCYGSLWMGSPNQDLIQYLQS